MQDLAFLSWLFVHDVLGVLNAAVSVKPPI